MLPDAGETTRRAAGLCKLRGDARGYGKRVGARVINFWWIGDDRILLWDIYAKAEREDLTADDIKKLKRKTIP